MTFSLECTRKSKGGEFMSLKHLTPSSSTPYHINLCPGQSYPLHWHGTRSIRLIEVSLSQDQPVMRNIHYQPSTSQHSFIFRDNLPGNSCLWDLWFCDLKGELSLLPGIISNHISMPKLMKVIGYFCIIYLMLCQSYKCRQMMLDLLWVTAI